MIHKGKLACVKLITSIHSELGSNSLFTKKHNQFNLNEKQIKSLVYKKIFIKQFAINKTKQIIH